MDFKKVVVLGGGVLGSQIALMSAYTGHDTTIWLRSEGSIERSKPKVERYRDLMIKDLEKSKSLIANPMGKYLYPKGLIRSWDDISEEKIDKLIEEAKINLTEKITLELDLDKALNNADIVIESMAENPDAKIEMYEKIKDKMDEKTILVTNSSTLLPSQFAQYTGREEKYLALHFANEIWSHNTAEIMGHPKTSQEAFDEVVDFAERINMVPIKLHKEQAGYVLNSLLVPFLKAGQGLWAKGVADPQTIDLTWRLATGAPAGPFQILDVVGLETAYNITMNSKEVNDPESLSYKLAKLLKEKIDKGETGVNAGKGFYDYN
ncbi:MAG: 3-hydroxyacyl-CoA dehydrogenase [Tissierellia bacterium]|nr:3-hydroxyacyl-CoA dehydrogenase [Tissierellia bacterium]